MEPTRDFASSLDDLLGFEVIEWREGFGRMACRLRRHHLNHSGIVHGGVLLTLLDDVGAMAGLWAADRASRRPSVTVSLTGQFTGRASDGRIIAAGTLVTQGRNIYFSRSEVTDPEGRVLAFGSSTHRYRSGTARPT